MRGNLVLAGQPSRACGWIRVLAAAVKRTHSNMSPRDRATLFRESLRSFVCDVRGVVAIEFALVMLPFSLLIFGIIEVAVLYLGAISLEDGVASAGREIRTGRVAAAGNGDQQLAAFQQALCAELAAVVACNNNLTIEVRTFNSFAAVTFAPLIDPVTGELVPTVFNPGGGGSINLVRVAYNYNIMTPLLGQYLGQGSTGTRTLESATVIQNEPF